MADVMEIRPAAEFQALPLEFIVSAPLIAAVTAQARAAEATKAFIESLIDDNGKPINVDFKVKHRDGGDIKETDISAPLMSIVPIPHLQIDSLNVDFRFEISQTYTDKNTRDKECSVAVETGGALSPWVKGSLRGSVSSKSSEESSMNRSGQIKISVHASEAPMPEGLAKVLNLLASTIEIGPTVDAPPPPKPPAKGGKD